MDGGMADTACYDTGQDATTVQYCTGGPQVITRQYRPARCGGEAGTRVNRKRGPCVCVVCVCPAAPPVFRCDLRAAREVVSPRARARRPGRPFAAWCRWRWRVGRREWPRSRERVYLCRGRDPLTCAGKSQGLRGVCAERRPSSPGAAPPRSVRVLTAGSQCRDFPTVLVYSTGGTCTTLPA